MQRSDAGEAVLGRCDLGLMHACFVPLCGVPLSCSVFCMLDSTIPPFRVLHAWRCLHSPRGIIAVVLFGLVDFGLGWHVRVGG